MVWDVFILLLALFNSVVVPIEISFAPLVTQSLQYEIVAFASDGFYLIDVILACLTSFVDRRGKEVINSNQIILRYMSGSLFYADLFAILGSKTVSLRSRGLRVFGFFKVIRIL
mmetsp:Transcript_34639/g.52990  ORF Transcript_34639/g.52990 Transcript_34639/m.52990 type:complete len:114 (-) Transcript_34639:3216-3557(-)